jgi:hypothetical protein
MKNEYEIRGDVTTIFLNHKGNKIETLIDTEDLPKVIDFENKWIVCKNRYFIYAHIEIKSDGKRKALKLHRLVMDAPKGFVVDNINHNTLDNRKSNLRVCTNAENCQNFDRARKTNRSGALGVYYHARAQLWIATVSKKGHKRIQKGYETFEEAKEAVIAMRAELLPFSQEAMQLFNTRS